MTGKLRIKDAPLLPNILGTEKVPTGGRGNFSASVDQIKDYTLATFTGALDTKVDKVDGKELSDNNFTDELLDKLDSFNPADKEDVITGTGNASDHYGGDKAFHPLDKSAVGLSNVDNTSDIDKPVSSAVTAALLEETTEREAEDTSIRQAIVDGDSITLSDSKAYADGLVVGMLKDRGGYDPTATSEYPTTGGSGTAGEIKRGDIYTLTASGNLGGIAVDQGDTVRALSNDPGQTASNWLILEHNLGYAPEPSISSGTTSQYWRGDKTWQPFPSLSAVWGTIIGTLSDQTDLQNALDGKEPTITPGTIAQYIRGDKSLSDFKADVLATALSGLVFTTNAAITATDSILAALGKLQAQVDKRLRFDASQILTAAEQTQLRTNMGTAAGLQFFDEARVSGVSRTLKPKLVGSETNTGQSVNIEGFATSSLVWNPSTTTINSNGKKGILLQTDVDSFIGTLGTGVIAIGGTIRSAGSSNLILNNNGPSYNTILAGSGNLAITSRGWLTINGTQNKVIGGGWSATSAHGAINGNNNTYLGTSPGSGGGSSCRHLGDNNTFIGGCPSDTETTASFNTMLMPATGDGVFLRATSNIGLTAGPSLSDSYSNLILSNSTPTTRGIGSAAFIIPTRGIGGILECLHAVRLDLDTTLTTYQTLTTNALTPVLTGQVERNVFVCHPSGFMSIIDGYCLIRHENGSGTPTQYDIYKITGYVKFNSLTYTKTLISSATPLVDIQLRLDTGSTLVEAKYITPTTATTGLVRCYSLLKYTDMGG